MAGAIQLLCLKSVSSRNWIDPSSLRKVAKTLNLISACMEPNSYLCSMQYAPPAEPKLPPPKVNIMGSTAPPPSTAPTPSNPHPPPPFNKSAELHLMRLILFYAAFHIDRFTLSTLKCIHELTPHIIIAFLQISCQTRVGQMRPPIEAVSKPLRSRTPSTSSNRPRLFVARTRSRGLNHG